MTVRDKEFLSHIGKRVRKKRKELGRTQQDVAYNTGITDGHISDIERGVRGLSLETAFYLARELGVPIDYMTKGWIDR